MQIRSDSQHWLKPQCIVCFLLAREVARGGYDNTNSDGSAQGGKARPNSYRFNREYLTKTSKSEQPRVSKLFQ